MARHLDNYGFRRPGRGSGYPLAHSRGEQMLARGESDDTSGCRPPRGGALNQCPAAAIDRAQSHTGSAGVKLRYLPSVIR